MAVDMNNGNVYVIWVVFTAFSFANVLFSRSTDGGNTFSRPIVISEYRAGEINSQGSTIQVTPDGTVHVAWIFSGEAVRYCYSTDQGQSFSTPQSICDVQPIPDTLDNGDYRTPTLLMSAVDLSDTNTSGSLYITWNDDRYGDADILLIHSKDGGNTWSEPIRVNNDTKDNNKDQFFSAVAVSPQGYVHMIYYDRRDDENNTLLEIYYAISKDGGDNFTFQANMTTESFDGNNAPHDFIGDYIGVTASNTTAYGIWCDTREGTPESGSSELYVGSAKFVCDECEEET
jgi:Neuraminidase (sialidase)